MMRKIFRLTLIGCLLATSLLFGGIAYAQDEELPDPGITPDSPFYFFDTVGKNIGMFFTFGPEAKARKALQYAEERLAEADIMAVKNRVREMTRATGDYENFMAMVNQRTEELKRRGATDNISETVASAIPKHLSVLDRITDEAPETAREAIAQARQASRNGQENALRALAEVAPERALTLAGETIENRLERARAKAGENMTDDLEEALDYAARIAEIEEEMAALAEENGIDIVPIRERLAQATSNRLEVLAMVYEQAPDQARTAIGRAIENSVAKYERAVEALREEGAVDQAIEESAVVATVRERLRIATASQEQNSNDDTENQRPEETQETEPEAGNQSPAASTNQTRELQTTTERVREQNP